MQVDFICTTDGRGHWSTVVDRLVKVVRLVPDAHRSDEDPVEDETGELRAYFDVSTWDVRSDGLIYTDKGWMAEFHKSLALLGFSLEACEDVSYSEQGMQGRDYVSMDIGHTFLQEFRRISGQEISTQVYNPDSHGDNEQS